MYKGIGSMTIGKYIKDKRALAGLSAREVARRAGVSDVYVHYVEKGVRKPGFHIVERLIKALGISFYDFAMETGRIEPDVLRSGTGGRSSSIPVVSWVTAGMWKEVSDAFEPGDADQWIVADVKGENVFALRVVGDSMEPEFKDGETVVVNPHVEAGPNDFVVVKNLEGEATFKQLKKYGSRWVLHPLNSNYQDQEVKRGEFRVIGKVVKKEKKY